MTPEQALQYLMQVLVIKAGLSVQDCAGVVQAWNVVAQAVSQTSETPKGEAEVQRE